MADPLSQLANEEEDIEKILAEARSEDGSSGGPEPIDGTEDDPEKEVEVDDKTVEPADKEDDDEDLFSADNTTKEDPVPRSQSTFSTGSGDSDLLYMVESEMSSATKDLDVTVCEPDKVVKTMESYIAFTVRTKTTRSDFEDPEYSVKRRYNDFLWLKETLSDTHTYLIIPPLPEKHNLTIDRFDKEFIRFRECALNRFLERLSQHPITSKDENLKQFLILEYQTFQTAKKRRTGILSRMTRSLSTMGGSFMLKNRAEEFQKLMEYANNLGDRMGALYRITERLFAEQTDYLKSQTAASSAYETWSDAEDDLSQTLKRMSHVLNSMNASYQSMVDETTLKVLLPIKEYMLYCESVKSSLAKRDAAQHEYEIITEELVKVSEEKNNIESNENVNQQAKLEKLKTRVKELEQARDHSKRKMETTNLKFKSDIERWHITKRQDLKELLGGMAQRNIETYDKHIETLEGALQYMKELHVAQ